MTLSVYSNDVVDWVVAESQEDAKKIIKDHYEWIEGDIDESYSGDFTKVDDDETLTIVDHGEETRETHTVSEWIEINGRGFLCSTEY